MKPINKQNLHNSLLTTLGALFGVTGAGIFTFLWITAGDRGTQADALQNGDHITNLDIATAVLMAILIVASVMCFRRIKDMSSSYRSRLFIAFCILAAAVVIITIVHAFIMQR